VHASSGFSEEIQPIISDPGMNFYAFSIIALQISRIKTTSLGGVL